MLRRIFLFVLTNIAVIAVISIILSIFNVQPYLTRQGLDYKSLMIYAAIVGFTGSFISLLMSKWSAKMAFGIQMIDQPKTQAESFVFGTVQTLAQRMGLGMPDVGIYDSPEPNAFATGWNKNHALVAVSTGLLNAMNQDELEAVLGHEMTHVSNGDMVTLALIQGVVNTFVIFFARIAAYAVATALSRNSEDNRGMSQLAYYGISIVFQILFGILASIIVMWFSRLREFRADAGSAKYLGKDKMINALRKLDRVFQPNPAEQQQTSHFNAMKIADAPGFMQLFASHPPIAERIAALEKLP